MAVQVLSDGLPFGIPVDHGLQTLGYEVIDWAEEYLRQPDGDRAGDPWEWTDTQARLMLWWHAIRPDGTPVYRRGQVVMPKGAGKSPLACAMACCDLGAPVLFDGYDCDGFAVGRPHPSPRVQIAAVSKDQTDNTMSLVAPMLQAAGEALWQLDVGMTRVLTHNGVLKPVTAAATSREGERTTSAILDETHLWTSSNGGKTLAKTIRRNLGKMSGRSMETTNTWVPGEESVAEMTALYADKMAERVADGRSREDEVSILRFHPQVVVPDLKDEKQVRESLEILYRDAPWVDRDRVVEEIYDPDTHPSDARRFYLNQIAIAADGLNAAQDWDASTVVAGLDDGDEVVLGFDGGKTDDATVLLAMRRSDRQVEILGVWEAPDGPESRDWEVPRDEVDAAVDSAFERFTVSAFFADVALWESYIDRWSDTHRASLLIKASTKSAVGRDMRGGLEELTRANEKLAQAVRDHLVPHTDDRRLRRHVLNVRRRLNKYGVGFGKENRESPKKVDAWSAMILADLARAKLIESGKKAKSAGGFMMLR